MSPPAPFGLLARAVAATESSSIAPAITAKPRLTMIPSFRIQPRSRHGCPLSPGHQSGTTGRDGRGLL